MELRLKTLPAKIARLENDDDHSPSESEESNQVGPAGIDEFEASAPVSAHESTTTSVITLHDIETHSTELSYLQNLFSKLIFFLSRETPRYVLEFVIRSFGGQVAWDPTAGEGSP